MKLHIPEDLLEMKYGGKAKDVT